MSFVSFFVLAVLIGFNTSITTLQNGAFRCLDTLCGMFFWGAHRVDGLWHVALIESAFKQWPPLTPILFNIPLRGYNYLLDFVAHLISLMGVPALRVYFVLLPIVWTFSMIFAVCWFTKRMHQSLSFLFFFLVLVFFGTNMNFLFSLYHHKTFLDFQSFGAALNLVNMQYAFSLITVLGIMGILAQYKATKKELFAMALLLSLALALKFYTGAIMLVLVVSVLTFSKHNVRDLVFIIGIFSMAMFMLYGPLTVARGEPIFSFSPFALSDRFIENSEYFYLPGLANAKYVLMQNSWGPRLFAIHLLALGLFVFFEFGIQLVGLVDIVARGIRHKLFPLDLGLCIAIIAGVAASVMFVQRGQWWNVVQFLYVSLFLMSYFSARAVVVLWGRAPYIIIVLLLLLAPFNFSVWYSFTKPEIGASYIQKEELEAIKYFKKLPGSTFLYLPADSTDTAPPPLWDTPDSPYVPALSGKESYIQSEEILKILDVVYEDRLAQVKRGEVPNVDYIYAYGPPKPFCRYDMEIRQKATPLYTNTPVYIYTLR
ncbi:hypothetical protein A3D08_03095 [Candidatus Roizmanbacteria bacterium RIFCSPHIGHO2_02_FULL_43_11]|uniref:Glycosyltransferase RgtA/B/C/D-like domain-containing protein n=1 Tax=Candidatus Roizmanbacteria bacterium RIFCSPHIGHO2_02_FULL_43_11 TaxID=1802043 RepID=A0A1F7HKV0_9BACT|nr:MAG: hypothetical protein A3D08_03095 [Candidatus Roizmanbacteria bacterium RIFCSPHIGHO2_02_FULL_43_11]